MSDSCKSLILSGIDGINSQLSKEQINIAFDEFPSWAEGRSIILDWRLTLAFLHFLESRFCFTIEKAITERAIEATCRHWLMYNTSLRSCLIVASTLISEHVIIAKKSDSVRKHAALIYAARLHSPSVVFEFAICDDFSTYPAEFSPFF